MIELIEWHKIPNKINHFYIVRINRGRLTASKGDVDEIEPYHVIPLPVRTISIPFHFIEANQRSHDAIHNFYFMGYNIPQLMCTAAALLSLKIGFYHGDEWYRIFKFLHIKTLLIGRYRALFCEFSILNCIMQYKVCMCMKTLILILFIFNIYGWGEKKSTTVKSLNGANLCTGQTLSNCIL